MTEVLDLGINKYISKKFEKTNIATEKIRKAHIAQSLDILTNHIPDVNGGYSILIELGEWVDLVENSELIKSKYPQYAIENFRQQVEEFNRKCLTLAYQIDISGKSVSSDNYNLRHFQSQIFGYLAQVTQVTVTYLSDYLNLINNIHNFWLDFMSDLVIGGVDMGDMYLPTDTDTFYLMPYVGAIYVYVFHPLTLYPKEIYKFIGVYPDNNTSNGMLGTRGQNEHYMKAISYKVTDYEFASYVGRAGETAAEAIKKFDNTPLFNEFMNVLSKRIK